MVACVLASSVGCGAKKTEKKLSTEQLEAEEDSCLMAVGNQEVTVKEFLFYVYQLKSTYDASLSAEIWNYDYAEDKTIESYSKESILEEIAQVKIIVEEAKKQKVALTEEEANEASVLAGQWLEAMPESGQSYGFTRSLVSQIYQDHALAKKMYDVVAGNVDTEVSATEAKNDEEKEAVIKKREKEAFVEAFAGWKKGKKIVVSKPLLQSISME